MLLMYPHGTRVAPIQHSRARHSRARVAAIVIATFASLLLLGGCGEVDLAETTASTVVSSAAAGSSQTSSPTAASGLPKLVDLGSDSCVPCQMMASELKALALEYAGSVEVVVVDIYESEAGEALAKELRVRVIPTQVFFDPEGNEIFRHEGFLSKEDMVSRFEWLGYPLAANDASQGQATGSSGGG
jgi:thioredoxin 1